MTDDIESLHSCDGDLYWHGCYTSDKEYKKYVTEDSYAHPAKASFHLLKRIFDHLEALGLLKEGDMVVDFMAGTGRTNVVATLKGYRSMAVELEPHFIEMIEANRQQTQNVLGRQIDIDIIKGDARKLSEIVKNGGIGVISPPYTDALNSAKHGIDPTKMSHSSPERAFGGPHAQLRNPLQYSKNKENIGSLRDDDKDNIGNQNNESYLQAMLRVYQEAYKSGISPLCIITKNPTRKGALRRLDLDTVALLESCNYRIVDYHRAVLWEEKTITKLDGTTEKKYVGRIGFFKRLSLAKGNVAAKWEDILIAVIPEKHGFVGVTSPPYSNRLSDNDKREYMDEGHKHKRPMTAYGGSKENVGNLNDNIVGIVSPPYADTPVSPQGAGPDQSFNKAYQEYVKTGKHEKFQEQMTIQNREAGYVGVVSPPYSKASDRISKGKIQEGCVADTIRRTYEKSRHSTNEDNIANLKDETHENQME